MKNSRKKMRNSNNAINSYGVLFNGANSYDQVGSSISGVGDVNQDGIDDFVIGGPGAGIYPYGAVYLIYGYNNTTPLSSPFSLSEIGTPLNTAGVLFNGTYNACMAQAAATGAGVSVGAAGDVNGDGIPDILIGAPYLAGTYQALACNYSGAAYVVYGRNLTNPFPPLFSLEDLMTSNKDGVAFLDNEYSGNVGYSVSGIGDVNGDKISDFLIGEPAESTAGTPYTAAGIAFLFYGRNLTNPFPSPFNLSSLGKAASISDGVVFTNNCSVQHQLRDMTGLSVSGAGDVNQDGVNDFLIGAPGWNDCSFSYGGAGAAYLLYGRMPANPFPPSFDLSSLGETGNQDGVIFIGPNSSSAGQSVSHAGDVNQDGISDFLIGAPFYDNYNRGTAFLLYGRSYTNPFPPSFSLSNLGSSTSTEGVVFTTPQYQYYTYTGQSVSGAGDVNLDGIDDFLIGEPAGQGCGDTAYLVFGRNAVNPFPPSFSLSSLTQKITLPPPALINISNDEGIVFMGSCGSELGYSVSSAGDINHDGISDFLIGAPYYGHFVGQTFLIYGQSQQQNATVSYSEIVYASNDGPVTKPLFPTVQASNFYEMPIQTFFGMDVQKLIMSDTLPFFSPLMTAGENNSVSAPRFYYSNSVEKDAQTHASLFTVHAVQNSKILGSIKLIGQPTLCHSSDGKKHNVIGLNGIFSGKEQEINRLETKNVCETAPLKQDTFSERAGNIVSHGIIAGASHVMQKALEKAQVKSTVAYAASQATYYTSLFMMYYLQHQAKMSEVTKAENSCYESAVQAATQTGVVLAINTANKGATYLAKKCEAKKWTYSACFFKAAGHVLNAARFAPQVIKAVNQPDWQSSAQVIGESSSLMLLGVASQQLTECAGDTVLNRFGPRK